MRSSKQSYSHLLLFILPRADRNCHYTCIIKMHRIYWTRLFCSKVIPVLPWTLHSYFSLKNCFFSLVVNPIHPSDFPVLVRSNLDPIVDHDAMLTSSREIRLALPIIQSFAQTETRERAKWLGCAPSFFSHIMQLLDFR